jgi:ribosomal protein S18 acetylase RimI-like enzyme
MDQERHARSVVEIVTGGAADLESLEPLWLTIHERHRSCMPALGPYVSEATSWSARRDLYAVLLDRPGTQLALALHGGRRVGYCLAYITRPEERAWIDDTWDTHGDIAEIESLGVLPEYRGQHIGERLLTAVEERLRQAGVDNLMLGALAGNAEALSFYAARGYVPTWTYLSKWAGRTQPQATT